MATTTARTRHPLCSPPLLFQGMVLNILFLCLLLFVPIESHSGCNFIPPKEATEIARTVNYEQIKRTSPILCTGCVNVDTYVFVFRNANGNGNQVTQTVIDRQMEVLNERFAPTPFRFTLQQTRFIINSTLHDTSFDREYSNVGNRYRQGDLTALNIYFGGLNGGSSAFFPPVLHNRGIFWRGDGAYVAIDTLPGGNSPCCNLGLTLVHEVGHWLGLHHTFEASGEFESRPCSPDNPNDFIDDTPQQSSFTTFECPSFRDSCPNLPGNDPIHNYMDYSSDICYQEFSPGQIQRMYYVWSLYRANIDNAGCPQLYTEFELTLRTDGDPLETHWQLSSIDGTFHWDTQQAENGLDEEGHESSFSTYTYDICIPGQKQYRFTITDSAGDGLARGGGYAIRVGGALIKEGRAFRASERTTFDTIIQTLAPTPSLAPVLATTSEPLWEQSNPFQQTTTTTTNPLPNLLFYNVDTLWVFGRNPATISQLNPFTGQVQNVMNVPGCPADGSQCGIDRFAVFNDPSGRSAYFILLVNDDLESDAGVGRMLRFDPSLGEFSWESRFDTMTFQQDFEKRLGISSVGAPVISSDGSTIFLNQRRGAFSAVDAYDGSTLWNNQVAVSLSGFALSDDNEVVFAGAVPENATARVDPPSLYAISTRTGAIKVVWNYTCDDDSSTCAGGVRMTPTVSGSRLLVNDKRFGNAQFDLTSFKPKYIANSSSAWFFSGPTAREVLTRNGERLYTAQGFVGPTDQVLPNFVPRWVNTTDYQDIFRGPSDNPIRGSMLLDIRLSRDESLVFYVTDQEIVGYETGTGDLYFRAGNNAGDGVISSVDYNDDFTIVFTVQQRRIEGEEEVRTIVTAFSLAPATPEPSQLPTSSPSAAPVLEATSSPTPSSAFSIMSVSSSLQLLLLTWSLWIFTL